MHERLRVHSLAAAKVVKEEGLENDLIERICADPAFGLKYEEVEKILDPANFVGLSVEQTEEFVQTVVSPILEQYADILGGEKAELPFN